MLDREQLPTSADVSGHPLKRALARLTSVLKRMGSIDHTSPDDSWMQRENDEITKEDRAGAISDARERRKLRKEIADRLGLGVYGPKPGQIPTPDPNNPRATRQSLS